MLILKTTRECKVIQLFDGYINRTQFVILPKGRLICIQDEFSLIQYDAVINQKSDYPASIYAFLYAEGEETIQRILIDIDCLMENATPMNSL